MASNGGNNFVKNPGGTVPKPSAPPDFTKKGDQPALECPPMPPVDETSVPAGGRSTLDAIGKPSFAGEKPGVPFKNMKG